MAGRNSESGTVNSPSGIALQFLRWVALQPRTYGEAMEAWRTSCPRLSVWEDAMADDLVWVDAEAAGSQSRAAVRLTGKGAALLDLAGVSDRQPGGDSPAVSVSTRHNARADMQMAEVQVTAAP